MHNLSNFIFDISHLPTVAKFFISGILRSFVAHGSNLDWCMQE